MCGWGVFERWKVELNQTSGRLRGFASWSVVRGLATGLVDDDGDGSELLWRSWSENRDLSRPTVESLTACDGDCNSLFDAGIGSSGFGRTYGSFCPGYHSLIRSYTERRNRACT